MLCAEIVMLIRLGEDPTTSMKPPPTMKKSSSGVPPAMRLCLA